MNRNPIIAETTGPRNTPDIWNDEPRKGCSFCGAYTDGGDWCARHAATEGPEVLLVAGMVFKCESFTAPNVWYTVSLAGAVPACSCPARKPCKHPAHVQAHVARLQLAQRAVWDADRATRRDRIDALKALLSRATSVADRAA